MIRDPKAAAHRTARHGARDQHEGIPLEEFQNDPLLQARLKEFRQHDGQPPEMRRAFEEAMGIAR